jgi:putative pyruvate formate lyase activating enzyme
VNPLPPDLERCDCCPRLCGANRFRGALGWCRTDDGIHVGSICLHRGEEPAIGGRHGICNVFFTHCNLQCVYCQNVQISRNDGSVAAEAPLSLDEAVDRIVTILDAGTGRLGFVSPSHAIAPMRAIIAGVHARGLRPTVVYNSGGYDRVEILASLADLVDVYLPDLKYLDGALAGRLSGAPDYPEVAARALKEMHRQKGSYLYRHDDGGDDGAATDGLVIRHLVLPGQVENSKRCLQFIAEELSPAVHVSLLSQYHPTPAVVADPDLGRCLLSAEYDEVVAELHRLGLRHGWVQELDSPTHYRPDFGRDHPFESA